MNPLLPYNAFITHMAAQPTLPSFYWQVYSYEQRIKEICIRLQRCILYNDYTVENVNQLIDFVNNLSTRVDELNDQIQDVNKRLLEEIERATAAEEEITNNLNAEIERAKAAEAELSTRIDKVSADLATETARAKAAEEELDGKITAEVNRATAKENQLQTAIDNEVSRATAKENELDTAIKAETQRAEQVEAKLSSDITAESQRAYQVEQQIKSDLTAEINRATTREDEIEAKVDDVPTVNSVAPLTVTTAPYSIDSSAISIGNGSRASASNAVAIGTGALANETNTVSFGSTGNTRRIVNVTDPTNAQDAATKNYVDNAVGGGAGGGMEFPDYATYKTLEITEPTDGVSQVIPDVDGYMLLWMTTTASQTTDRHVYISVPDGPSRSTIADFPIPVNTQNKTGAIGVPIPVKAGTNIRIMSTDDTMTLLAVRHYYKAQ